MNPMQSAAHAYTNEERAAQRRALNQKGLFFTACRGVSIISGGFLFGSNLGVPALIGTAVGIIVFAFNEALIRRDAR